MKNKVKLTQECQHFVKLCKKTQKEMKKYLTDWLTTIGYKPVVSDGYIYAEGTLPVCVTAHMDTVHREIAKDFEVTKDANGWETISSPQGIGGDDRCGIFMIQRIVDDGYKPTILFCEDEEIGGIGSDKFCMSQHIGKLKTMKFFIELDRAHDKDLVYYSDSNEEFHKFCAKTTGYKEAYGSFSDISNLCPEVEISGVNISCGYYNAHHTNEYVVIKEMMASIKAAEKLLDKANECEQFKYKKRTYRSFSNLNNYYGIWNQSQVKAKKKWYVCGYNRDTKKFVEEIVEANSDMEAIGMYMSLHRTATYDDIYDYYDCSYMLDDTGYTYGTTRNYNWG